MSHNRNHIIIQFIIDSGQFSPAENTKLSAIAEKDGRCSTKDAETVARIVKKKLREPLDEEAD